MFPKFKSASRADRSNRWHFNALSYIQDQLGNLQSPAQDENVAAPCFKVTKNSKMVPTENQA